MKERHLDTKNTKEIFEMINQVASGNFNYQISPGKERDLLSTICEQLNLMAQELKENFKHFAYVNPHLAYKFITHSNIILDQQGLIAASTPSADIINDNQQEILGTSFMDHLRKSSRKDFKVLFDDIKTRKSTKSSILLKFKKTKTAGNRINCFFKPLRTITKECFLSISFFETAPYIQPLEQRASRYSISKWDVLALQEAYDYILKNVGQPKQSDSELAEMFKLSTNKLKKGFKEVYGMSPSMFYNKVRIEEAKARIEHTHQPLKLISDELNFKSYTHFSAAFKAYFGKNPSDYQQ